ncbi:MAG: wax ester/triacylglycerol synthase family O-acyltransferase [Steroidobacteraceae bacterium]
MLPQRESMASVDTAWLHMDRPDNLMSILGVLSFARRIPLARVRRMIEERFLVHPRFRMRPVDAPLGAYWEHDGHFDLNRHVREVRLPRSAGPGELQRYLGSLASTPFDPRHPRWEFLLVLHAVRGCSLVMHIHHCYADGIALIRVLLSLADPDEQTRAMGLDGPRRHVGGARESGVGGWIGKGVQLALHPQQVGEAARAGAGLAAELARIALLPEDSPSSLRARLSGIKHVAQAEALAFDEVRRVARGLDCTINDVLTATVAAALRRWLRQQGDAVARMTLHAAVPVNLRDPDDTAVLGNEFGLVMVALPVGIADPIERVRAVRAEFALRRLRGSHSLTLGLLAALGLGPRAVQEPAIDLISSKASLVMSNVPGPRAPLHFCGERMTGNMFWVPQSGGIGVGVSVLTYAGHVFGLAADAAILAELQRVVRLFASEFRRLARRVPRSGGFEFAPAASWSSRSMASALCWCHRRLQLLAYSATLLAVQQAQATRVLEMGDRRIGVKLQRALEVTQGLLAGSTVAEPCRERPDLGDDLGVEQPAGGVRSRMLSARARAPVRDSPAPCRRAPAPVPARDGDPLAELAEHEGMEIPAIRCRRIGRDGRLGARRIAAFQHGERAALVRREVGGPDAGRLPGHHRTRVPSAAPCSTAAWKSPRWKARQASSSAFWGLPFGQGSQSPRCSRGQALRRAGPSYAKSGKETGMPSTSCSLPWAAGSCGKYGS